MASSTTKFTTIARRATLAAVLLLGTGSAVACPVCAANRAGESPRAAWPVLATTGAMLALPVSMVAGFAWWLKKNL